MKILLFILAWFFFVLGAVGLLIPILPTTPFMILAALCFSKSSEKFHNWMLNLPLIGPPIHTWKRERAIGTRAKFSASALMTFSLVMLCIKSVNLLVILGFLLVAVPVLTYIWTRPNPHYETLKGDAMTFRARHILVDQEHEAQDVLKLLSEGQEFGELAAKFSKCPSGKQGGGDLGTFSSGQMVPPFEEAVKTLGVGEVSQPVRTQFGYHIIERLEA